MLHAESRVSFTKMFWKPPVILKKVPQATFLITKKVRGDKYIYCMYIQNYRQDVWLDLQVLSNKMPWWHQNLMGNFSRMETEGWTWMNFAVFSRRQIKDCLKTATSLKIVTVGI